MMWSPSQRNGWWPRLSPDGTRVVYGTGGDCWLAYWRTGVEQRLNNGADRLYPLGWPDNAAPITAIVPPAPIEEPALVQESALPSLNLAPYGGDAWGGSWCAGHAGDPSRVWVNGIELPNPGGWACRCHGLVTSVSTREGIRVWTDGVLHALKCGEVTQHFLRRGLIGYQQHGRAWVTGTTGFAPIDITVSPSGRESAPMTCDGWAWNVTEGVDRKTYIQGRLVGSNKVIVRERPLGSQNWIDVVCDGDVWVVASCHDGGVLVVEDIPVHEPTRTWAEILKKPIVIPPFERPVHVGYVYRDTYAYAKNPTAPGNVTVVVGEARAALTADPCVEDGLPIGRIIGPDAIETMGETADLWATVQAIYLSAEMADDATAMIRRKRDMCRGMVSALGLSPKPFLVYTGPTPVPDLADGETWIGVQLYLTGTEGPDDLRALADRLLPPLAHLPVALIAQAYDRRTGMSPDTATYTGDLAALQLVYADLVRAWANVKALIWFSDGRPGGTRDHEEMRPWHRAIAAAARRTR